MGFESAEGSGEVTRWDCELRGSGSRADGKI